MKRYHIFSFIVAFAFVVLRPSMGFAQDKDLGLTSLIEQALQHNPQVQQAYHRWKAEEHKIDSAKSLPDPMLKYAYFGESVETRVGPQEQKFGVAQKIPFPGKLALKQKAQNAQAQAQEHRYLAIQQEIVKQVKLAYYDLFFVTRAIETSIEEKEILESLASVAQQKYESNLIPQQDVVKLDVQLSEIMKKIVMLRQNRQSITARINRLVHRSPNAEISVPDRLGVPEFAFSLEDSLNMAGSFRQELLAAEADTEMAGFKKSLSEKEFFPDVTLQYEYIDIGSGTTSSADDGNDAWMAGVSINIPLWFGKQRSQIYESRQQLQAAESMAQDLEDQAMFEVKDLYYQIIAQKDVINLYETSLLPQAEQVFDSSQVGFESGTISFLDWLDAERTNLSTHLAYYRTLADYYKLIASFERVIGKEMGGDHEK